MQSIFIALGSNLGNRHAAITAAAGALAQAFPTAAVALSSFVESDPMGFDSPNGFVNAAMRLDFDREAPFIEADAHAILRVTQAIEKAIDPALHRNDDGSYRDRTIDIDIIAVGDLVVRHPRLTLPHPQALNRPFVAGPLAELNYPIK